MTAVSKPTEAPAAPADAEQSLYRLIESRFPKDPNELLLETPEGDKWSYADAHASAGRYARFLTDMGVKRGDRVAVQVEKSPQALFLYLACLRAGFVFLPMNTAYREDEVDFLIGNAEPSAFVCRPDFEATAKTIAAKHGTANVFTLAGDGGGSFTDHAESASADFETVDCAPDDLAAMLYTSGTTGKPKGAMLTHRNLGANGLALVESWRFTADDVLLHALPIFHAHGLFVACHCVLLSGARMIWLPGYDREKVMELLPRATVFMGVPTFYTRLLALPHFGKDQTRNIRLFVSGSAPLLAETHREFSQRTGHMILERYGMTETGMNTSNPYDGDRVPGSVGMALPGVEARVVDDGNRPLPANEVGNIQVRGANVMKGYWKLPEKTAEEFTEDGWFKTGDQGKVDDRGYIHIVGRAKDMIISGGYNVYPKEIESLIDDIDGVVESAIVGVPHPDFGEVGVAVIVRREGSDLTEDAVLGRVKEKLANYKVPKAAYFVQELPRNTMGKVQKAALREAHKDLFKG
ncbi:malonyl-CoA synthase [Caenispirillum salinarum]|uniref:malonate--CoA ligase n=1 Tax=Caenispirillum salinarum TaxID=859058 RepID=UPI00384A5F85